MIKKKKKSDILFEQKTTAINRERRFQATAEPKVRHAKKNIFRTTFKSKFKSPSDVHLQRPAEDASVPLEPTLV